MPSSIKKETFQVDTYIIEESRRMSLRIFQNHFDPQCGLTSDDVRFPLSHTDNPMSSGIEIEFSWERHLHIKVRQKFLE